MSQLEIIEVPEFVALVRRARCRNDQVAHEIGRLYGEIMMGNPDAELADAPCLFYTTWEPEFCEIEAALPVDRESVPHPASELKVFQRTKAAFLTHVGPYTQLHESWTRIWQLIQQQGLQPSGGAPWDRYATDPAETSPEEAITELYVPVL